MADELSYWEWYKEFLSRCDYVQGQCNFMNLNAKSLKLDKAKSIISVGAGNGIIDACIVSQCTPQLEAYIGVEPDKTAFDDLCTTMQKFKSIQVSLVNEGVPGWRGPDELVDVVLVSHVLYYIPDRMAAVKQFLSWLRPGGSLIIVHSYSENIFVRIVARDIEMSTLKRYGVENIKAELEKERIPFRDEGKVTDTIPQVHNLSDDLLKLYFKYLVQDFPEDQLMNFVAIFRTYKEQEVVLENGCIRLEKPSNPMDKLCSTSDVIVAPHWALLVSDLSIPSPCRRTSDYPETVPSE